MLIEIKSDTTTGEVAKKLESIKPKKNLDTTKYLGKIKWDEDALAFQKRIRNEWK